MKKLTRMCACLIAAMLLLSSCAGDGTEAESTAADQTGSAPTTSDTEPEKPLADPLVLVSADGKVNCTVTVPKDLSEEDMAQINDFVKDIKGKTGVELPIVDEASAINTKYEIAINAEAGREPVSEQLAATAYTDYKIGLWDWHIMITAHADETLRSGLSRFVKLIEKIDEGYCIREDIDVHASTLLGERKTSVPAYDTEKGSILPLYSVKDGYEVCVQNSSQKEFLAYAEKLAANGFTKYSEGELPSATSAAYKNLSYVYTTEDMHVFMNWNVSQNTARVVFTKPTELPSLTKPTLSSSDNAKTSIAQIGIGGLGMSYAIQLKDYSFIVIDGGTNADSNVTQLYDYMVEKTPSGKNPVIECWIFTHPDPDHIGAPHQFLTKYMEKVELRSVAYNFPDCTVQDTSQNDETMGSSIFALENLINRFYAPKVYTIHTGQKFYFKGVEMDVLFTEEDLHPLKAESYNSTSAMMRFTFDNGKTFMVLGDATEKTSKQLAATYGSYLKSDMLQLAHHGLIGGDKQLYMYIDPEICFWATAKERYEGKWDTNKDGKVASNDVQHCLGQGGCNYNAWIRDTSIRVRTHYHGGETFVVNVE